MAAWTPPSPQPAICSTHILHPQGCVNAFLFVTLKESDLRVLVPSGAGDFQSIVEEGFWCSGQFGRLRAIAQGPDGALYIATSNRDRKR